MATDYTYASDRALGARIRASDHAAFKACFYRYYEPLFRFVARRLPAGEPPHDLVQEVFARLWQRRSTLDPAQSLKAYLFRIANNLLVDQYRKTEVRRQYLASLDRTPPRVAPVEHFDVAEHVRAALEELPPALRETFILSRFDALTYREIAALLGVSVKTVESRMSKALKLLRAALHHALLVALLLVFDQLGPLRAIAALLLD